MRNKVLILFIFFPAPFFLKAQLDSSHAKEVLLTEVVIQAGSLQRNSEKFTPDRSIQNATDKILDGLGGVSMIRRGNYAWEPAIRGLNNGQIITTIDGMAIFGACTDRMDPVSAYIEPNNLKSIAISYGQSESTPGNTIGGGFDFKIQQPALGDKQSFSGVVGAGFDLNGNGRKILTSLNYGDKRWGINLNGIYRASDSYKAGGGVPIAYSQFSKWNGGLGGKYKPNAHNLLLLSYIRDEGYNIGYPALSMDVAYAKANIVSLTHQLHLGEGLFTSIENKIYFNTIKHAMDDTKRRRQDVFMHMDMPGTSDTKGLLSTAAGGWGKHRVTGRLNLYENKIHAEMTMYPDHASAMYMLTLPYGKRDYAELSFQDEWKITQKITIQSGISGSVSGSCVATDEGREAIAGTLLGSDHRTDLLYSFSVTPSLNIRKNFLVFASGGYTMRTPTLQELYGLYLFNRMDNFDYLGNPELSLETSVNLSGGFNYRFQKVRLSGKVFSYLIDHYIAGTLRPGFDKMTHSAAGVKQYQNIGKAVLYGFEAEGHWNLSKAIELRSLNSFSFGRDEAGNALPLIPPFRSIERLNIRWRNFNYRPEIVFNASQNHVSEIYGETATASSLIIGFFTDYIFNLGPQKMALTAGVENIFDNKYAAHNDILKVLRPGRSISFQLSWYF